jgi:hypothetical protein
MIEVEEWGLTMTVLPREPGYMMEILREISELKFSTCFAQCWTMAQDARDRTEHMSEDWPEDVSKVEHLIFPEDSMLVYFPFHQLTEA